MFFQHGTQCTPLDVFRDQVILAALLINIQEVLDVWMAEAIANLRFTLVALEDSDIAK